MLSMLNLDGWRYIISTRNLVKHTPAPEPCWEGMMS